MRSLEGTPLAAEKARMLKKRDKRGKTQEAIETMGTAVLSHEIPRRLQKEMEGTRLLAEEAFNALCLEIFAFQFERNLPYQAYCRHKGRTPNRVRSWKEVPPVPVAAFKEFPLFCGSLEEAGVVFMTSGTTRSEKKGKHYLFGVEVYDASLKANFHRHVLPDRDRMKILALAPPPAVLPNSSLSHYLDVVISTFGEEGSGFFMGEQGLDTPRALLALDRAVDADEAVAILATPFSLLALMDDLRATGRTLKLPEGSRLMDTGGYKGKGREVSREELYAMTARRLSLPRSACVSMYGMTELSSQFYDRTLVHSAQGLPPTHTMEGPPWTRTLVLDFDTLAEARPGEPGLLAHYDLANWDSVAAILTEDLGTQEEGGFRLHGRLKGAEARGCAAAIDELLQVSSTVSR